MQDSACRIQHVVLFCHVGFALIPSFASCNVLGLAGFEYGCTNKSS